ncbi:MAG: citrate synthase [Planctomycetes bacterium]|nr:citrate synthase [Planctomycetota bacterium]
MTDSKAAPKAGLEGVAVADSAIGKIDGSVGELRYCGYLIKDLAEQSDFVETSALLWDGELPNESELESLRNEMKAARALTPLQLDLVRRLAGEQQPMDCLRTVVSACATGNDVLTADPVINRERSIDLTAKLPTIVAAYDRVRKGLPVVEPRDDLDHASNFLYMLTGSVPDAHEARMFDTCLVLHAEHGFNASTFSARVTAATLSDIYSAITSAIGTLRGPLHGGANTAVMNMLLDIGSVDAVESYVDALLQRGEKIMGFGHRVYKVVDPRALILKQFASELAQSKGEPKWFEMSQAIENLIKARKGLDMNVDFYSASTYHYMGIDADLFTCVFAMSRVAGWTAHVLEQYSNNRLIRPRSNWVGPDARDYVPLGSRR